MSVNMGGEGGGEGDNTNGKKYHWSRYLFGLLLLDPGTLQRGHDCRRLLWIFPVEEGVLYLWVRRRDCRCQRPRLVLTSQKVVSNDVQHIGTSGPPSVPHNLKQMFSPHTVSMKLVRVVL